MRGDLGGGKFAAGNGLLILERWQADCCTGDCGVTRSASRLW